MRTNSILIALFMAVTIFFGLQLAGCDPINRHMVVSTIFDGVPSLPPAEQICAEYYDKRVAEEARKAAGLKDAKEVEKQSVHPPYEEKNCDGCHDKTRSGGFVRPIEELCFKCHKDFIKGEFVHGPVAVADCLFCHVPHNSTFPSLLKIDPSKICFGCHKEKRSADEMHTKVMAQKMKCIDCHDPHYGNAKYFLK